MANLRKTIFIVVIVAIVLALIFVIYLGWQRLIRTQEAVPGVTPKPGPATQGGGVSIVSKLVSTDGSEYKRFLGIPGTNQELNQRASLEREGGSTYLKITDLKTNNTRRVKNINLEDVNVIWPAKDTIIFFEKPSALLPTSAWSYDLKSGGFDFLFEDETGLMIAASDNGDFILKFTSKPPVADLILVDRKNKKELKLPFITLPNKCAFTTNKIYCAIPSIIPPNISLPDDYLKNKFLSDDKIISYQLNPIEVKTIFDDPSPKIDAINLVIKDKSLYFTNRLDNKVYLLPLE